MKKLFPSIYKTIPIVICSCSKLKKGGTNSQCAVRIARPDFVRIGR